MQRFILATLLALPVLGIQSASASQAFGSSAIAEYEVSAQASSNQGSFVYLCTAQNMYGEKFIATAATSHSAMRKALVACKQYSQSFCKKMGCNVSEGGYPRH